MEEIRREVMTYVNGRVASFSRLSEVKEQTEDFEKTPSMKIKRFKYSRKRQH
jgi:long-chain acyl-CoA synthetase